MQAYLRRLAQDLASFVVVERPRKAKIRPLEAAGIPVRSRIVDDLGDLHELDGWREPYRPVTRSRSSSEKNAPPPLRSPNVEIHRPLLLLIEGKEVKLAGQACPRTSPGRSRPPWLPVRDQVAGVGESDGDADHGCPLYRWARSPCLALRRYALALQTASRANSVSTHMLTKDRRDGLRNAGGTGGPSAWELDCHASLTSAPQVRRHLRLSVGIRQVPFLTLAGTHGHAVRTEKPFPDCPTASASGCQDLVPPVGGRGKSVFRNV